MNEPVDKADARDAAVDAVPAEAQVYQTAGTWGRSTAKYHWQRSEFRGAACSSLRLAEFSAADPSRVPVEDRCRARGCRERWAQVSS